MAINTSRKEELIRHYAYNWYEIRMKYGIAGNEKSDWERAKTIVENEHIMENPNERSTSR